MVEKILWKPDESIVRFREHVNSKYGLDLKDYHQLHAWSVDNIADFWDTFWYFSNIIFSEDRKEVVDDASKMPGAKWFSGARMNFAENLLKFRDDRTAIIFRDEKLIIVNGKQITFP